ncbi:hypothetical protein D3C86_2016050 [compost metagenome]
MRKDRAARIRLQTADEKENALVETTSDPVIMGVHKFRRLAPVGETKGNGIHEKLLTTGLSFWF